MVNKKLIWILLILISLISVIALDVGNRDGQEGVIIISPRLPTNITAFNTNSSDFWDSLDTPFDISVLDLSDFIAQVELHPTGNTTLEIFASIPHATPSDGDTTHYSLADEIYDWVIGLNYIINSVSDLVNYFTKTDVDAMIRGNRTQIEADIDVNFTKLDSEKATHGDVVDNITEAKVYSDSVGADSQAYADSVSGDALSDANSYTDGLTGVNEIDPNFNQNLLENRSGFVAFGDGVYILRDLEVDAYFYADSRSYFEGDAFFYNDVVMTENLDVGGNVILHDDNYQLEIQYSGDVSDKITFRHDGTAGFIQMFEAGVEKIRLRTNGDSYFINGLKLYSTLDVDGILTMGARPIVTMADPAYQIKDTSSVGTSTVAFLNAVGNDDVQMWRIGMETHGNADFDIKNDISGGHVDIKTTGEGRLRLYMGGTEATLFGWRYIWQKAGTLTTPSYSFITDTNTGMNLASDAVLNFITNGVNRVSITNDGLEVIGNQIFLGDGSGLPFGGFYGNNIGFTSTDFGGGGTFVIINGLTSGETNAQTFQNNQELKMEFAGRYLITWSASVEVAVANKHIELAIGIGGTANIAGRQHIELPSANKEESCSGTAILDLAVDDTISLMITNVDDNAQIEVHHINLVAINIGGT